MSLPGHRGRESLTGNERATKIEDADPILTTAGQRLVAVLPPDVLVVANASLLAHEVRALPNKQSHPFR